MENNELKKNVGIADKIANDPSIFKIKNYINGLASFIENCETPLTMAVQGAWGTGKTSIMNMLNQKLTNNCYKTFYFNTWQFSQLNDNLYENFIVNLNNELTKGDHKESSEEQKRKVIEASQSFIKSAFSIAKDVLVPDKYQSIVDAGIESVNTFLEKKSVEVEQIKAYRKAFQSLVKETLELNNNTRLVIFIDDLDRLEPSKVLELLDIIKLFLDVEKCIFILAVDYEVIIDGVQRKYGSNFTKQKGKEYFDKIIQVPFHVPTFNYDIDNMIKENIKHTISEKYHSNAIEMLKKCSDNNPRTIKRMLNSYYLMNGIMNETNSNESKLQDESAFWLFIIQCIQTTYNELFDFTLEKLVPFWDNAKEDPNESKNGFSHLSDNDADLDKYISNLELSSYQTEKIYEIMNYLIDLLNDKNSKYENFRDILYRSAKSNNVNVGKREKGITVNKISLSYNNSQEEIQIKNVTMAFSESVDFIINKNENKAALVSDFNLWITNEKPPKNSVGFFRAVKSLNDKYFIGTSSNTETKMKQLSDLYNASNVENMHIKWIGENDKVVFELPTINNN